MGGERASIKVSEQVKAVLDRIKERDGHTTYDSVIRALLYKAGEWPNTCRR